MKRLLLLAMLNTANMYADAGDAYAASCQAALHPISFGDVERGSREWQKKHDDWIDGKTDEKPSDDYDGHGYKDSQDAAKEAPSVSV